MAWTDEDLVLLDAAIKAAALSGYAEVTFSDRTVRRYSLKEMWELRQAMSGALRASTRSNSCTFGQFSKG